MYNIKNTLLKGLLVLACGIMAFGVGQMSGFSTPSSNQSTDQVQVVPVRGHGGGGHWGGHGHWGHGGWGGGGYSIYIGPGYGYGYGYPYGYGYDSYYYSPYYYYYPY